MPDGTPKKVLVRGPNWLGDAVMCEPALQGLKRVWPGSQLFLLVKPAVAQLFQAHPVVDRLVVYEDRGRHAGLTGKWALAGDLRRERFDVAVLFQNAFEAAFIAFLAGIPRRYGYATDGRSMLLTEPVAPPDPGTLVHQVHYYWNLLKPLGLSGEPSNPGLRVTPEEEQSMAARLMQAGIGAQDPVIGVNPGSTYGGAKRWLPDRFTQVAERLSRKMEESHGKPAAVLILGAKGEEAVGRSIAAGLTGRSMILSGATTIRELMAAVKRCAVLVTNDTGPMHIGSAFGVPIVAVFGPTDWRTTSPYGAEHALIRHPVECAPCLLRECPIDHRCMTGVSVDQVYDAAAKLIRRPAAAPAMAEVPQPVRVAAESSGPRPLLDGVTVFLDRDGTLNEDTGYLRSAAELKLLPGVTTGLSRLKAAGARLVVVTNQSGVGRGFFTLKDLEGVHARLQGLLEADDAALDAIYFCPHHPDDGCRCRKPARGMVDRAVAELQLDLRRCYLVGDHARDIQLAHVIGAKSVLLVPGAVDEAIKAQLKTEQAMPDLIARTMIEAAEWILKDAELRADTMTQAGDRSAG
ncbi:Lipopolysaccharide heptosyltransferase II and D, D-heptose 1,7-bisphosphate phosphatase (Modular protein) [Nitrospira japonica]|uniref:lipopolysaccharide heptosyltransferase II n=1 Tax=Nitrospira japonica TaxID=1325564 RepID=A0A1W1HZL4_9BACT|nr:lipopolysaccharide heptosyltransferase II [Nitrospira japonica]SLM46181.1 Lipopolysaccharide heptosyltransferase II and D, D-heptose 1,7-bisphosphate phosphatase (Modular protein) [Nitrospira japonica]